MIGEPRAGRRGGLHAAKVKNQIFRLSFGERSSCTKKEIIYPVHEGTANFFLFVFAVKIKICT